MNPDENYIYQERLAILGVIGREPTETEQAMALDDVRHFQEALEQQKPYEHTNP